LHDVEQKDGPVYRYIASTIGFLRRRKRSKGQAESPVLRHLITLGAEDWETMEILLQVILALLLIAAAVYVHKQIPVFTKGRTSRIVARTILIAVGVAFGLTGTRYVAGQLPQVLTFFIGFGLVHMPAAIVLFIKGKRGEGKS
jgi:hypothetical protein